MFISFATRPPPQTDAPSITATPPANVSTALRQAQEQWSRSDRPGALATVEAALASQPDDPALRRFLGEIVSDARARAERAEAEARQVRAEELAAQRFQEAAVKLKDAESLTSAGQPSGASKLWEAEALFMAAAVDARSAAVIPPADQKLAAILQEARDLWTRRNRAGALALLSDQLAQHPQSQPLQALLGELATDAARSTERARAAALGVRAPELTRADFARADAKATEAKQLQRSARSDRAVQAFLEAEGLFAAAVLAAESAKPPPPEDATPPADAPQLNASAGRQGLPEIGSAIRPPAPAPPPPLPLPRRSLRLHPRTSFLRLLRGDPQHWTRRGSIGCSLATLTPIGGWISTPCGRFFQGPAPIGKGESTRVESPARRTTSQSQAVRFR